MNKPLPLYLFVYVLVAAACAGKPTQHAGSPVAANQDGGGAAGSCTADAELACTPPSTPLARPYCHVPSHISAQAQQYLSHAYPQLGPSTAEMLSLSPAVQQVRETFDSMTSPGAAAAAAAFLEDTQDTSVAGVPCVYATPKGGIRDEGAILVYLHGGGYVVGTCRTSGWSTVAMVAQLSGLRVLCVEYRLAPEHPFPAALEDALAVYKHLLHVQQYNPTKIAVLGDSAGGGLAMALLQALNQQPLPLPQPLPFPGAVGLYSPWIDLVPHSGDTLTTLLGVDPMLGSDMRNGSAAAWAYVGGDASLLTHPLVSPLRGTYDNATFPPTLIQVGLRDMFISHASLLYRRMRDGGQRGVVFSPWEGMWHVFQAFLHVPEAQAANKEMAEFFVEHLGAAAAV